MNLTATEPSHLRSEGSRSDSPRPAARYPLLEALLEEKGLKLKGIYTVRDAASIFGVSVRTIQDWVREGKLIARDLPGRGRFLSGDLERLLQSSIRCEQPHNGPASSRKELPHKNWTRRQRKSS